jgi:hypothetical protein
MWQNKSSQKVSIQLVILVSTLMFSTCTKGSITFSDGVFNTSDWQLTIEQSGNGGNVSFSQESTGGNPDEHLRITDMVNAAPPYSLVIGAFLHTNAIYFPRTQGEIVSLEYSEDSVMFQGWGGGQSAGPALRQNGVLYYANYPGGGLLDANRNSWTHYGPTSLKAEDFGRPFTPDVHPDFSSEGSPIEFGFYRCNSTPVFGYTIIAGIDNWSVTIHNKPPRIKVHALLVGCEQFAKGSWYHGMKDAKVLEIALLSLPSTTSDDIRVLKIDSIIADAKTRVVNAIRNFIPKVKEDETFVLFVGSHGMEVGGCLGLKVDSFGDALQDQEAQLTREDLTTVLGQFDPNVKKVVILPGCYTGSFWSSGSAIDPGLVSIPNICLFSGAPENEVAYYFPTLLPHQVILPWYLVPDLSGMTPLTITISSGLWRPFSAYSGADTNKDGTVTFQELKEFIELANYYPFLNFGTHYGGWNEFVNLDWPILDGMGTLSPFIYHPDCASDLYLLDKALTNSISLVGDFEPDGDVDMSDFAILAAVWRVDSANSKWNPACDISDPNDGIIDEYDLAVFMKHWLEGE